MSQVQVAMKIIMVKTKHKHVKPLNVYEHLHLNSETDSEKRYCRTTDASTKHNV